MTVCLLLLTLSAVLFMVQPATTQPAHERVIYRNTPQRELELLVYRPADLEPGERRPAVVLFHGGGWNRGTPDRAAPFGVPLVERGMVVILPAYRTREVDDTSPFVAVNDAFAAVRYVRANAEALNVDPERLAVGGSSAGAHLAAATSTLDLGLDFTRTETHPDVDPRPDALVMLNPVYDNSPGNYGHDRVKERWREFSPMQNLHADMPPTIVFCGTKDPLIPVKNLEAWRDRQRALGVRSELVLFEGGEHGFWLPEKNDGQNLREVNAGIAAFFESLGWIKP